MYNRESEGRWEKKKGHYATCTEVVQPTKYTSANGGEIPRVRPALVAGREPRLLCARLGRGI